MSIKLQIPYQSPEISIFKKYLGVIFTTLTTLLVTVFLWIFISFSIRTNLFEPMSVVFVLFPFVFLCASYFIMYDYRNNLTQLELNANGVVVFNTFIPWKDILKVYRKFDFGNVVINFEYEGKRYRAFIDVELILTTQIIDFISENAESCNPNFDTSKKLTFKDIFTRVERLKS